MGETVLQLNCICGTRLDTILMTDYDHSATPTPTFSSCVIRSAHPRRWRTSPLSGCQKSVPTVRTHLSCLSVLNAMCVQTRVSRIDLGTLWSILPVPSKWVRAPEQL